MKEEKKRNIRLSSEEKRMEAEIKNGHWITSNSKEIRRLKAEIIESAKRRKKRHGSATSRKRGGSLC